MGFRRRAQINVFMEAIGLVAIAYATFGVVSFLEVRNLNNPALSSQSDDDLGRRVQRPVDTNSEDDFAEFVDRKNLGKPRKNSKPKPK
jgi:hypothetical protein